ncbi:AAA family ATPase [Streptomyces sp. 3MP-14]|uniref:AAA family ATPase n=1 Tax=Streptomyces mimosae TaxID=2586635 RepID=A0A5N6AFF1_9ACTN|nr:MULTISPECIES: AAA family ATPase [Streptomyces]KAB8166288.1 AAA family ATPase [Streptomyces mimosae]KAB8174081.1 AAA family ATPase [Streptomyces sp. 3MP-14]
MAQRRLTRQELSRQRREGGFVGRRRELDVFRENLARDPQGEEFRYLFHVRGNGGVGKSSLIRRWERQAVEHGAVTAVLGDEVHDVIEAMEAVAVRLRRQGAPLKDFEAKLAEYRQRRHEAERELGGPGVLDAAEGPSPGGLVAAQAGLMAAGALPVVGAVAGAVDPAAVAAGVDRLRSRIAGRLRGSDDARLVLSPVRLLTPVFLGDLAEVARKWPLVALFFDVYERTGSVLDAWLREVICEETLGSLEANVLIVLSGQGPLHERHWGDWRTEITEVALDIFSEQEAHELLGARGVHDPATVEMVLRLSGRLPVLVDMLAHPRPTSPGEVADPAETAVDRFLKWVDDPDRRTVALACALPLHLDEDVYRSLAPEAAADAYAWLRGLPFVGDHEGRYRYHATVRALMLRHQRRHFPSGWAELHARLAELLAGRREAVEADRTPGWRSGHWNVAEWRQLRHDESYHLLCARPAAALRGVLADVASACD